MSTLLDSPRPLRLDLEIHIHKRQPVSGVLDLLCDHLDAVAITTRGSDWKHPLEHSVSSILDALDGSHWHVAACLQGRARVERTDGALLDLIEAQELLTREDFDLQLIGCPESLPDFLPISDYLHASTRFGALAILGHPYFRPNRPIQLPASTERRALIARMAASCGVIVSHNQAIHGSFPSLNRRSSALSVFLQIPGVSVSDLHLYGPLPSSLPRLSHVAVRSLDHGSPLQTLQSLFGTIRAGDFARQCCDGRFPLALQVPAAPRDLFGYLLTYLDLFLRRRALRRLDANDQP